MRSFRNAQPSAAVSGHALATVTGYLQKHRGLWVGGRVVVTPDDLTFTPNALNMMFYKNAD